jgi:hypothetical protein
MAHVYLDATYGRPLESNRTAKTGSPAQERTKNASPAAETADILNHPSMEVDLPSRS